MAARDIVLGIQLREAREEARLTQRAVADQFGHTRSWLSQIEHGRIRPPWEVVVRLASIYGAPLARFQAEPQLAEERARSGIEEYIPIPYYEERVSASLKGDSLVGEAHLYIARRNVEPGHRVFGARVHGNCMAPRIEDGDDAIIDVDATAKEGDVVFLDIEGEANIKVLSRRRMMSNGREMWALRCNDGEMLIEPIHVRGVVTMVQKHIRR